MGTAGILDCLRGEEEVVGVDCVGVVTSVLRFRTVGRARREVFEEEYHAVDWTVVDVRMRSCEQGLGRLGRTFEDRHHFTSVLLLIRHPGR